jgi:hypothetical protein
MSHQSLVGINSPDGWGMGRQLGWVEREKCVRILAAGVIMTETTSGGSNSLPLSSFATSLRVVKIVSRVN